MAQRDARGRFVKGSGTRSAPGVKVEIIGVDGFKRLVEKYGEQCAKNVSKALAYGAYAIQATARKLITDSPKNGTEYRDSSKSPKVHKASTSPSPPANWTGNLRRGIQVVSDEANATFYVVSTAKDPDSGHDYGATLEVGSNDGRIKKRPFMRPAFKLNKQTIDKSIKAAIQAAHP